MFDFEKNRKVLYPNILVYKNLFKDINNTLRIIKDSENQTEDKIIDAWKTWGSFGYLAKAPMPTSLDIKNLDLSDEINKEQYDMLKELENIYEQVARDYINICGQHVIFPEYVTTLDLNNEKWGKGALDLLKHIESPDKKLAMHYHTDNNAWSIESRGLKHTITITMYLEEDHDGGEVSFAHIEDDGVKVTTFYPEAGDVVVFPSVYPYFHGVLPIKKGSKYLIRTFYFWNYEGSNEWLANEKIYGTEVWQEMEEKRMKDLYDKITNSDFYSKNIGQNEDKNTIHVPDNLPSSHVRYIHGRDL